MELNETRDTMQLLKTITDAFKTLFPADRKFELIAEAREMARQFLEEITSDLGEISANDRDVLLGQGFQAFLVLRAVFCNDHKWIEELDKISKEWPRNSNTHISQIKEQMEKFKVGLPFDAVQVEELAVLTAIVLTQPISAGLENAEAVDELSGRLSSCLHTQMCLRGETDTYVAKAFANLVRKLTELFR